ncbi:MAG: hypothetical protein Q8N23_14835 [Archangium sp.]|nr:hypothetical protein [Archangium sp.]MDP3574221.1 hypothetical protein [Archangium sp.]
MALEKRFKVGRGGAFFMFLFVAVGGLAGAVIFAMAHDWAMAGLLFLGALFGGAICFWMPGVLQIDDNGLTMERRKGTQALRWGDIKSAVWDRKLDGLAGAASDSWAITITGDGTTIVLSGPKVERPQEVRALLEARFPPTA